jgi:hypothetical protein
MYVPVYCVNIRGIDENGRVKYPVGAILTRVQNAPVPKSNVRPSTCTEISLQVSTWMLPVLLFDSITCGICGILVLAAVARIDISTGTVIVGAGAMYICSMIVRSRDIMSILRNFDIRDNYELEIMIYEYRVKSIEFLEWKYIMKNEEYTDRFTIKNKDRVHTIPLLSCSSTTSTYLYSIYLVGSIYIFCRKSRKNTYGIF